MISDEEEKMLREKIRRLEEENKRLKKIEEEYQEHKHHCSGLKIPAFVKEDVRHAHRTLGAHRGHKGYFRRIPERVDYIEHLRIASCPCCGGKLSSVQEIRQRVVEDIPEPQQPIVTRYIIERKYCSSCKKIVEPEVPDALPGARIGLRAMLLVAFMKIRLALPVQKIVEFLRSQYSFLISPAEVVCILDQVRREFGEHYAEIERKIRDAPVKGCDETGWRLDGKNHWVWAMVTEEVAWYKVHRRRSYKVIAPILKGQQGKIMVTDRLTTYNHLMDESGCAQQICWAHILRDTKKLAKSYEAGKTLHRRFKSVFRKAKSLVGHASAKDMKRLHARIERIGALRFEQKTLRAFRDSICKKHRDDLFHFVINPAVPSTNNGTERAIRKAVIIRKISNGNRSERGARILETLLSVIESMRLQKKNPLEEMYRLLASRD